MELINLLRENLRPSPKPPNMEPDYWFWLTKGFVSKKEAAEILAGIEPGTYQRRELDNRRYELLKTYQRLIEQDSAQKEFPDPMRLLDWLMWAEKCEEVCPKSPAEEILTAFKSNGLIPGFVVPKIDSGVLEAVDKKYKEHKDCKKENDVLKGKLQECQNRLSINNPTINDGVFVTLPHITKDLEAIFKIMWKNWKDLDPKRQPKQVNIAREIDMALGLGKKGATGSDPSRDAKVIAKIIKPDATGDDE
ncbi:hypothetical protein CCP3SC15_530016 [Gammaproteobacteria bacterium]